MADMDLTLRVIAQFDQRLAQIIRQVESANKRMAQTQAGIISQSKMQNNLQRRSLENLIQIQSRMRSNADLIRNNHRVAAALERVEREINLRIRDQNRQRQVAVQTTRALTREMERQTRLATTRGRTSARDFIIPGGTAAFFDRMDRFRTGELPAFFDRTTRSAHGLANALGEVGRFGKFTFSVLQAFLLYRGFIFLKVQLQEFIGELIRLEHQVGLVQTQLNNLGQDFRADITREVISAAQETGLRFSDIAKAQFEIISANIDLADSYEVLDLAAKAAVAGGIGDVELAFNSALAQVNAFNLSNQQFNEVFDKQFNLIKRGIFTYEQFATVSGTLAESFASMGQDIDTANASLAAISQIFTGKQIERGATGLRNAVLRIGEAPDDFEALGVAVRTSEGEFRNFISIGKDLNAVLDGMTESQRFEVVRNLFPDERERRGIEAFLDQIEEAEQFYVEQKFATGDLEEAFDTMNDTIQVQAGIFRNDLIPAMDPVVGLMGGMLRGINAMDDALPGFTKNVAILTTAVVGLAVAQAGLNAAQAGGMLGANPASANRLRRGLGAGIGVAGLALSGTGGFVAGQRTGTSGLDVLGTLGGGGLAGGFTGLQFGGPMGAAIGAGAGIAIAGIGLALGEHFEKQAEPVAKSFAESFRDALVASSGDVAASVNLAIASGIDIVTGRMSLQSALRGTVRIGNRRAFVGSGGTIEQRFANIEDVQGGILLQRAIEAGQQARAGFDPNARREALRTSGLSGTLLEEQAQQDLRTAITEAMAFALTGGGRQVASGGEAFAVLESTLTGFADVIIRGEDTTSAFNAALSDGVAGLGRFLLEMDSSSAIIDRSSRTFANFADINFAEASEVFSRLGESGMALSEDFAEAGRLVQANALLSSIGGLLDPAFLGLVQAELSARFQESFQAGFAGDAGMFIDALLAPAEVLGDGLSELQRHVQALSNAMRQNDLEERQIRLTAQAQGRELTAEENARIFSLQESSLSLEMQQFRLEEFGSALDGATEAVKRFSETAAGTAAATTAVVERATGMRLDQSLAAAGFSGRAFNPSDTLAGAHAQRHIGGLLGIGQADIDTIRAFDRLRGGAMLPQSGLSVAFNQFVQSLGIQAGAQLQRGSTTIIVRGDALLSDLDQAMSTIRRIEPQQARRAGRLR